MTGLSQEDLKYLGEVKMNSVPYANCQTKAE